MMFLQRILYRILAALGIGGARIFVELQDSVHPRGSEIRGQVIVVGGFVPQHMHGVTLELVETTSQGRGSSSRSLRRDILAKAMDIRPTERRAFAFRVRLPDGARLTTWISRSRKAAIAGCLLKAEAHTAWGIDPRAGATLNVVQHSEITAIQEAFVSLGFREAGPSRPALSSQEDAMVRKFIPLGDWRTALDAATLQTRINGGSVEGRLFLNLREINLAERLQAMLGGNRLECDFTIPRAGLNPDTALPYLKEIIDGSLLNPADPRNRLLRPAEAPNQPEKTLLRPATSASQADSRMLLRPATPARPASDGQVSRTINANSHDEGAAQPNLADNR